MRQQERIVAEIIRAAGAYRWVGIYEVDAAYGGPAILAGDHSARLAAIARADSITLDPHKWLYVPVEAGAAARHTQR